MPDDALELKSTPDPINTSVIDIDKLIEDQLRYTAQSFPQAMTAGAFLIGEAVRGPILPQYGTKERDRILRMYDQYEYNGIWQGAVAGLTKKITSSPWEIIGSSRWTNFFQIVLQKAHFGQGWDVFLKRVLHDYLTQDYGAFIELIGPGPSDGPINGPVVGIAHLDSGRCFVTGNPTWPVVYFSLLTGALHKMHHSRIVRMVDMPNPDERYFGIGYCALSRCIGAVNRQIRMGRFIDSYLDDKPKPGLSTISGLTKAQFERIVADYTRKQGKDDGDIFGKSLMLFSLDTDKEVNFNAYPFAETPEKFDFIKYTDLDVNSIALGLGVDRNELWELAGRMLGSASQSNIMAQKAESKAFGDIVQIITRIMNTTVLPVGMSFQFRTKNTIVDAAQAENDNKLATALFTVSQIPDTITGQEIRSILSNRSKTFAEAFQNNAGDIALTDEDVKMRGSEVHLRDEAPADDLQKQPTAAPPPAANPTTTSQQPVDQQLDEEGKPVDDKETDPPDKSQRKSEPSIVRKEFDSDELTMALSSVITGSTDTDRMHFGIVFRGQLRKLGLQTFEQGLKDGGVLDPSDSDDAFQVASWVTKQSADISDFADLVYAKSLTSDEILHHAKMWTNKSLAVMYFAGLMSADKNGTYQWNLGKTEKHCPDCERLDGQVHRFKEWFARDWLPRSDKLWCNGFECDCRLTKVKALSRGRF